MTIKLNVGCGKALLDDCVNIDLYPMDSTVVQGDIRSLPFSEGTVDSILAIDVIEHVPRAETLPTLRHWFALLKPGATVEARCPDSRKQCALLMDGTWTTENWSKMVFGGQDTVGNFHMAGFDQSSLAELFRQAGFVEIKVSDEYDAIPIDGNANFRITAKKP